MQSEFWPSSQSKEGDKSWLSGSNVLTRIMGFSFFASLLQSNSYMLDSAKLLILGTIIETGRRLCQWLIERFRFQYSITAQFNEGDPTYDWIILFLTQENLWQRSREFRVTATSSLRKWSVQPGQEAHANGHVEYVPTYEAPQLFRWKGYWVEIKRSKGPVVFTPDFGNQAAAIMYLTVYTRDMSAISAIVESARARYLETSRPNVIVHSADQPHFGPVFTWGTAKSKVRRPLSSIILPEGVIDSLLQDAREFLETEDWYLKAGIPHRRGYLLHGPPGSGKSSTIYALAGELGLEIYSLSLASGFVDDSFLQRAVAAIPKDAIFLIEDIDCAFPASREDGDEPRDNFMSAFPGMMIPGMMAGGQRRSNVTLSGLLNVLDGVGSEEGKLFFATTNFIDHLDPALLRPGRIDRKIQYKLATKQQAAALFIRFYPESYTTLQSQTDSKTQMTSTEKTSAIEKLAEVFALDIPEHEFSTAELQGYLLACKRQPEKAVEGILAWVAQERKEREERKVRESERKAKSLEARDKRDATQLQGSLARLNGMGVLTPMNQPPEGLFVGGGPPSAGGQVVGPAYASTNGAETRNQGAAEPPAVGEATEAAGASSADVSAKPLVNGTSVAPPVLPAP
ncbi:P-loop containing nucleoside triphosphate hydrolase protein [Crassisporium funariophilum]|nr:P-loop containing nucleoside triphosphate hydrolase protein [Crassisporium funariophilum]